MDSVGSPREQVQRFGPSRRLGLWIAVVIAALASPAWLLLGQPVRTGGGGSAAAGWTLLAGCAWSWLALTAMWALLATTPDNAIKLSRRASAIIIYACALWLAASRALVGDWLARSWLRWSPCL